MATILANKIFTSLLTVIKVILKGLQQVRFKDLKYGYILAHKKLPEPTTTKIRKLNKMGPVEYFPGPFFYKVLMNTQNTSVSLTFPRFMILFA